MPDELLNDIEVEADTEQPENPTIEEPADEIVGEWNLTAITEYVTYNAIDNEDFLNGDTVSKVRFLNIALRTLLRAYADYSIPDEAIYLFACVLNANYNDTMVIAKRGATSFSVDGISFSFPKGINQELSDLITEEIKSMIFEANPDIPDPSTQTKSRVKWVTL